MGQESCCIIFEAVGDKQRQTPGSQHLPDLMNQPLRHRERTLAMAQRLVHQVRQVLAPGCLPLFVTDGLKDYATALLTHWGHWVTLSRRWASGPAPKPRWMPQPEMLYAQVVKTY